MDAVSARSGLLLLWAWASGCAYHVRIDANVSEAVVRFADGRAVPAPTDHRARFVPLAPGSSGLVVVEAPGYRPHTVDLRREVMHARRYLLDPLVRPQVAFGRQPRGEVRVLLVPEHGPAGSW